MMIDDGIVAEESSELAELAEADYGAVHGGDSSTIDPNG